MELIELSDRILSATFDKQASSIVEERIKDLNSNIFTQNTIEKIYMDDNRIVKAQLTDGSNIDCQVLVVAVGVAPEVPFVDSGALDTDRGIKVNQFMETSAPGIFAAGDVVQARDILAGEDRNIAIWPLAVMQGKTAGLNMAGSRYAYGGGFFMNSVEILGISSISMGLTSLEPDDSRKVEVLSQFKPESNYYKKIIIRENKVVGAILVGAIERAGIYAGLIKNGIDVGNIRENIISENFGLIQLPADYQKHLVVGEGIEV
ncbi:MAG: FAD-dependent oxidoreductase [Actinomycetota bacterium]|nr:FAD-dependent oxidoreductase [Actinomycetota bacterium]